MTDPRIKTIRDALRLIVGDSYHMQQARLAEWTLDDIAGEMKYLHSQILAANVKRDYHGAELADLRANARPPRGESMTDEIETIREALGSLRFLHLNYRIDVDIPGAFAALDRVAARLASLAADNERLRNSVIEFHWMARRYCDGRMSTAPGSFNSLVRYLIAANVPLNSPYFARDGMGRAYDGLTDAEATAAREDMPKGHASLEAEWTARTEALRANALDFSSVPEGYTVSFMMHPNGEWSAWLRNSALKLTNPKSAFKGDGPTPSAALSAAIERAKEAAGG